MRVWKPTDSMRSQSCFTNFQSPAWHPGPWAPVSISATGPVLTRQFLAMSLNQARLKQSLPSSRTGIYRDLPSASPTSSASMFCIGSRNYTEGPRSWNAPYPIPRQMNRREPTHLNRAWLVYLYRCQIPGISMTISSPVKPAYSTGL